MVCVAKFPCFVFKWFRGPRALHSFPTRRSSDLRSASGCRHATLSTRPVPEASRTGATHAVWPPGWYGSSTVSADRKSTRLNSSHLGISYAVFCLKKKTKHLLEVIHTKGRRTKRT